jgi:hypothetical protein
MEGADDLAGKIDEVRRSGDLEGGKCNGDPEQQPTLGAVGETFHQRVMNAEIGRRLRHFVFLVLAQHRARIREVANVRLAGTATPWPTGSNHSARSR